MRGTGPTSRRNDDDNNDLSACVERIGTDASLAEWSMAAVPKTEKDTGSNPVGSTRWVHSLISETINLYYGAGGNVSLVVGYIGW